MRISVLSRHGYKNLAGLGLVSLVGDPLIKISSDIYGGDERDNLPRSRQKLASDAGESDLHYTHVFRNEC